MFESAYSHYEAEARTAQSAPAVKFSRGKVELDALGHFRLTLNLGFGPLRTEWTREEAIEIADAILRLHNITAPPSEEE